VDDDFGLGRLMSAKSPERDLPKRQDGEKCAGCGHWSVATEYGLDENSGYCDRWEKITSRGFWCDEYVSKAEYDRYQQEMAEESEEWMDDD
jgi:hypothetical protein